MSDFEILEEHSDMLVPVRGRSYLAGSESMHVPESIPMANDMTLTLALRAQADAPAPAAALCRAVIDEQIDRCGSILLKNLPLKSRDDFEAFMQSLDYPPCSYAGGIAVRSRGNSRVLPASLEDARVTMAPHNEMAYLDNFPKKVFFFCAAAAAEGGEVAINDIRESAKLIPQEVLSDFRRRGVRYSRYLPRQNEVAQIGWPETFGTDDRQAVERMMREKEYDYTWLDGGGISYNYVRPAFARDAKNDDELWFNQISELHCSYWQNHPQFPASMPESAYPATTFYGDGQAIDPELITFLRATLWQTSRAVKMQPGDILVLDNHVIQHGRFAYTGRRHHMVSLTN